MFKLATTSRPVMPGEDAYLLLEDGSSYTNYFFKKDQPFSLVVENPDEKFCIGWYDLEKSQNHHCETSQQVDGRYTDCYICRAKTGFNPAFYNTTEISPAQAQLNKQPHLVYLAYFGEGLIKVGITASRRGHKRLFEQGALFYAIIAEEPNANDARKLEARLVRSGIKESVLRATKSNILQKKLDLLHEEQMFKKQLSASGYEKQEVINAMDAYFFGDIPENSINPFPVEKPISGLVRGVVGRYLVLENNDRLYGLWLNDYFGKKVKLGTEISLIERAPEQASLF